MGAAVRRGEPWAAAGDRRFGRKKIEDERIWEDSWARIRREKDWGEFSPRALPVRLQCAPNLLLCSLSLRRGPSHTIFFFFETQAIRLEHGLMYFETFSISTTSTSSFFEQESLKMTLTNY